MPLPSSQIWPSAAKGIIKITFATGKELPTGQIGSSLGSLEKNGEAREGKNNSKPKQSSTFNTYLQMMAMMIIIMMITLWVRATFFRGRSWQRRDLIGSPVIKHPSGSAAEEVPR